MDHEFCLHCMYILLYSIHSIHALQCPALTVYGNMCCSKAETPAFYIMQKLIAQFTEVEFSLFFCRLLQHSLFLTNKRHLFDVQPDFSFSSLTKKYNIVLHLKSLITPGIFAPNLML